MAINKDEIEKYIFDPKNPNQCKSYNLLLNLANTENLSYFSPDFLKYFFRNEICNIEFKEKLWDIPINYNSLTVNEKFDLFKENYSSQDLEEYITKNITLNTHSLTKLQFYNHFVELIKTYKVHQPYGRLQWAVTKFEDYIKSLLLLSDKDIEEYPYIEVVGSDKSYLFFSFNYLDLIEIKNIKKASIFVTLESNTDIFFNNLNKNKNIKPIFLKKIEDVEILLNVLEQDLKKEKQKSIPQENISILNEISIQNFFSIKDIKLNNLKNKKEIYIVGENGNGKSLFLQSIVVALVGVKDGDVFDLLKSQSSYNLSVKDSKGKEYTQTSESSYDNIIAYGSARNNYCQMKEDTTGYLTLFKGEYDLDSPIKWLQYLDYSEQSDKANIITVAQAKKLLQEFLNSDIDITITPDKVIFTEKGSEVSFEQLSVGYKGVIIIICDLIARLAEKQEVEDISDFQGVVLIDEVELHLHPKWQYSFMTKLRETFPLIQFIVTTHSPTVLLGAGMEAVYYQIYKEEDTVKMSEQEGIVKISEQKEVKNNFLNDIQNDIFGFDVNDERINNPSEDDKRRQKRAKEAMLGLIDTIEKEQ